MEIVLKEKQQHHHIDMNSLLIVLMQIEMDGFRTMEWHFGEGTMLEESKFKIELFSPLNFKRIDDDF